MKCIQPHFPVVLVSNYQLIWSLDGSNEEVYSMCLMTAYFLFPALPQDSEHILVSHTSFFIATLFSLCCCLRCVCGLAVSDRW